MAHILVNADSSGRTYEEYVQELISEYAESLDEDRRYLFGTYRFVDMARKVVGVGSVGTADRAG